MRRSKGTAMADDDRFEKQLPDGTTIYGSKKSEGTTGYRHGHFGPDFSRTEHSTVGSAAVDAALGADSIGHTGDDHPTTRS